MNEIIVTNLLKYQYQLTNQIFKNEHWPEYFISDKKNFYNLLLAHLSEIGELIDSMPFKWWKKQELDRLNVLVELTDILHFVLMYDIVKYYRNAITNNKQDIFNLMLKKLPEQIINYGQMINDVYKNIDNLGQLIAIFTNDVIIAFRYFETDKIYLTALYFEFLKQINKLLELTQNDIIEYIYQKYLLKNALNKLRQEEGYKQGEYNKLWNGVEDNQYIFTQVPDNIKINTIDEAYKYVKQIYENLTD